MKAGRYKQTVVYVGVRFVEKSNQLFDTLHQVTEDGEQYAPQSLRYLVGRRTSHFAIGQVYEAEFSGDDMIHLDTVEQLHEWHDDDAIATWSAQTAAARRAKVDIATRSKMIKAQRDLWFIKLEPLREAFWHMTTAERRAMRTLVDEWLYQSPRRG